MNKLFIFIGFTIFTFSTKAQTAKEAQENPKVQIGAAMPDFKMRLLDSTIYETKNEKSKNNTILMLYNPGCGHCIEFTKKIIELRNSTFKDYDFLLLAADNMQPYMKDFIKETGYTKKDNITLGLDMDKLTFDLFIYQGLPQLMLYDTNKKLIKIISKDIKPEMIIDAYQNKNVSTLSDKTKKTSRLKKKRIKVKN
jgi:thiol-disulfide isomerase/thioredoxin